ncbi:hypothetical protein M409DRAFT_57811 [Zasmidium cellare ATCC 36951]|uniref:Protein kinase domain-containing protein n=1 Tax=Zasmidium cellare ATCC 36951 TaxID=1080233 RepID=A0A6A6CCG7_ZASCE|nr:uncharacterized protein M409DRAFT_57811 [Zasmidium cellare ATCC 36951]KAF2163146.1 hypothetical protein M409DRAFT_57811 [Zasmidium cellare ATCC 36951]
MAPKQKPAPLRPFKKKSYAPGRLQQYAYATKTPSAKADETESPRATELPSFAISGLSWASAFVLELVQSRVTCTAESNIQILPYAPAIGSSMAVRRGMMDGEIVAVKEVRNGVKDFGKALADALFEVRVMSHKPLASHRNVVSLRAVSFADDDIQDLQPAQPRVLRPLIVVDWSLGDLTSHLLERKLDFTESAELVADIADGLQILHLYGITHADLKPDNVLLFSDPDSHSGFVAKLADFGFPGSEEHRQERKGLTSRWAAPAAGGHDDYLMKNTECPGDVFSFGLVAMFVAVAPDWDSDVHLPDCFHPDIQRAKFDYTLDRLYGADEFAPWHKILHSTVVSNPNERLTTQGLGTVRELLLGHDRYAHERRLLMIHMIPFRGMKGAQNNYRAELEFSKMSWDFSAHAKTTWKTLPKWMKTSIREDYMAFDIQPAKFYKHIDDDLAIRIIAVTLLGIILLTTEPTTPILRRQFPLGYMAWRVHEAGTRLGIEDLDDRPPVWRLAAKNKVEEALSELRRDPSQLTYKHRGHTIVHYATLYGKPKLLAGILETTLEAVSLVTARGFTPLFYAAAATDRRSEECLDILLDHGADVKHISPNGESLLLFLYMGYMQSGEWTPITRNLNRIRWYKEWAVRTALQRLEDRFPRTEEERREAQRKNDELLPPFMRGLDWWDKNREGILELRDMLLNNYGPGVSDALLEKIERIRQETGPCDDMLTLSAGFIPFLEFRVFSGHLLGSVFSAAVVLIMWITKIFSSFWEGGIIKTGFTCYTYFVFCWLVLCWTLRGNYTFMEMYFNNLTGNLAKTPLLDTLTNEKGSFKLVEESGGILFLNFVGMLLLDFLIRENELFTLAIICLVVEVKRTNHRLSRFDREMRWIQRVSNIDGEYDEHFTPTRENTRRSTKFKVVMEFQMQMRRAWRKAMSDG